MNDRLYRSRHDRVVAGVAGGLAGRLGADPSLIRIVWVILMPLTGFLALGVYVVMALVVPEEPEWATWPAQNGGYAPPSAAYASNGPSGVGASEPPTAPLTPPAFVPVPPPPRPFPSNVPRHHERTPGAGGIVIGSILVLVGIWLLLEQFYPNLNFDLLWPLFIVGAGVVLLVAAVGRGSAGSGTRP